MRTRIAVIGSGRWGALHARKVAAHPDAELTAVVDPDLAAAEAVCRQVGAGRPYSTLNAVTAAIDAAHIVTPVPCLALTAIEAIERGWHVLIEKPMATTVQDAERLLDLAHRRGVLVSVGFLERFNITDQVYANPGSRLCFQRSGLSCPTYPDLLLDWAIHDIDLVHALAELDWTVTSAREQDDRVVLKLRSKAGREARILTGSGVQSERRMFWIDKAAYSLRDTDRDALALEISAFISRVRGGAAPRLASGADGLRALRIVEQARRARAMAA